MSYSIQIANQGVIDGTVVGPTHDITGDVKVATNTTVAAAKAGTLSTRTSDTVGTLTLGASHGVTTGARLDLYWVASSVRYRRYGITVGTVSGTSVPFTGGAGDNLPAVDTAITCMVPTLVNLSIDAEELEMLAGLAQSTGAYITDAMATFLQADGDTVYNMRMTGDGYLWHSSDGTSNPLNVMAGTDDAPTKIYLSHCDSDLSATMRVIALYNN